MTCPIRCYFRRIISEPVLHPTIILRRFNFWQTLRDGANGPRQTEWPRRRWGLERWAPPVCGGRTSKYLETSSSISGFDHRQQIRRTLSCLKSVLRDDPSPLFSISSYTACPTKHRANHSPRPCFWSSVNLFFSYSFAPKISRFRTETTPLRGKVSECRYLSEEIPRC